MSARERGTGERARRSIAAPSRYAHADEEDASDDDKAEPTPSDRRSGSKSVAESPAGPKSTKRRAATAEQEAMDAALRTAKEKIKAAVKYRAGVLAPKVVARDCDHILYVTRAPARKFEAFVLALFYKMLHLQEQKRAKGGAERRRRREFHIPHATQCKPPTHTHALPQRTTTRLLEQRRHGPTPRTRSKGGTAAELLAADEPRSSSSSEAPQNWNRLGTNRLVRKGKGRDRRRRARPGKSNRGGRRGGAAQQQQPPRACERLPPSQQQRDRSTCSQRGKKLERRHHGHWLGLCGGQPPSARYWRHHAAEIVPLGASTPCHRAVLQSCKLVASELPRRHNTPLANNEIAVDVDASTPHVIGAGSRPTNARVREREPRRDCKIARLRDGRDFPFLSLFFSGLTILPGSLAASLAELQCGGCYA